MDNKIRKPIKVFGGMSAYIEAVAYGGVQDGGTMTINHTCTKECSYIVFGQAHRYNQSTILSSDFVCSKNGVSVSALDSYNENNVRMVVYKIDCVVGDVLKLTAQMSSTSYSWIIGSMYSIDLKKGDSGVISADGLFSNISFSRRLVGKNKVNLAFSPTHTRKVNFYIGGGRHHSHISATVPSGAVEVQNQGGIGSDKKIIAIASNEVVRNSDIIYSNDESGSGAVTSAVELVIADLY